LRLGFGPASMSEQTEESDQQNNNRKGAGAKNGVGKGQKLENKVIRHIEIAAKRDEQK
jgi:hypothetical protein